jgi:hypothetical protein
MTNGLILTSLPEMSIITYNFNIYSNICSILTVVENFGICKYPYSVIAKLVITPKSGWTDGGGLTRLHNI